MDSSGVFKTPATPTSNNNNNSGSGGGGGSSSIVSLSIHGEIHRFESVHPSIYAIYELIEHLPDNALASLIREHVVNIEDSFVNSQEWTLSRSVQCINIGLLGDVASPKSTLVHRYLTGQFVEDNSPEGGRFKKEILINGKPYLLLIRDEGTAPTLQFTHWLDVLILVAGNSQQVSSCYGYISRLASYKSLSSLPIILASITTPSTNSQQPPPFINEFKKIPHNLHINADVRSGLNVDKIFSEACSLALVTTNNVETPITTRKINRRKSNIFSSSHKDKHNYRSHGDEVEEEEIFKQGILSKKSYKVKKYKKKYATLTSNFLIYYDSINNYMENKNNSSKSGGKKIDLKHCSLKSTGGEKQFSLQTLNKLFEFEAPSVTEKEEWIVAIETQILSSLELLRSELLRDQGGGIQGDYQAVVKGMQGNDSCADCGTNVGVDWVSVNLGVVICISCSGIHRSIGSHVSKVRCLKLDEISPWTLSILLNLQGNTSLNEIYEHSSTAAKSAKQENKSSFIKRKYENLEFSQKISITKESLIATIRRKELLSFFIGVLNSDKRILAGWAGELVGAIFEQRFRCHGSSDGDDDDLVAAGFLQLFVWFTETTRDFKANSEMKRRACSLDDNGSSSSSCRIIIDNL